MIKSITLKGDIGKRLTIKKYINDIGQVNFLVGSSGCGKSSLLKYILDNLRNDELIEKDNDIDYKVIYWNRNINDYKYPSMKDVLPGWVEYVAMMNSVSDMMSDGESTIRSIMDFLSIYGNAKREPDRQYIVVLDGIDVGITPDRAKKISERIKEMAADRPDMQFFIAAHGYEILSEMNDCCINMYTARRKQISSYNAYMKMLDKHSAVQTNLSVASQVRIDIALEENEELTKEVKEAIKAKDEAEEA